jgi:mannose-1-phosphate guanylyltransferase
MFTKPDSIYAVVLAGGSGTRFWPKSRLRFPKQLCALGGQESSMLEITLARLDHLVPPERRIIVTHKDQVDLTRKMVGPACKTIIAEPEARNTANAIAVAALEVERLGGEDSIMLSLHADHVVRDVMAFESALRKSVDVAGEGRLVLLGLVPKYAETGYGYIERGAKLGDSAFNVASFKEKPDAQTARSYLDSGKYYWNAGLFVFPTKLILKELEEKLSSSMRQLRDLQAGKSFMTVDSAKFGETYSQLPKISIDHAILETSRNVAVVETDIGWQDVGSWDALGQCFATDDHQNFIAGDALLMDSKRCTVDTDGPLITLLGCEDLVVVHAKGAILVCPKERAQDVKLIVDKLKANGRTDLV